jgi:hypothetical protein
MKNIITEHTPFEHKDLEYINNSLNLARQQRASENLEGMMSATLIYTNLVEYLADNLLQNLHHAVHLASCRDFQATFFIKNQDAIKKGSPKPLGGLIDSLGRYEFPDHVGFIQLLKKFGEKRNKIFHGLLKTPKEKLPEVDDEFIVLHDTAEEILNKYNLITTGMTTVWMGFVVRHRNAQSVDEKEEKIQELQTQISSLLATITSLQSQLALPVQSNEANKEKSKNIKVKKKNMKQ